MMSNQLIFKQGCWDIPSKSHTAELLKHFDQISQKLTPTLLLTQTDKVIYYILHFFADKDNELTTTIDFLSQEAMLSIEQVRKTLKKLEIKEIIKTEQGALLQIKLLLSKHNHLT